ncbi:PKS-ER domain-containing protein [Favolaschia claudopus]|uniref:PKS-ER domain-containing protein n=1 Tax=Favolaschia claudopus TaxID=2862362 RepID=A0AAW0BEJ2_9AGAR
MATHSAIAATSRGHFDEIGVKTPKPGSGEILLEVTFSSMVAWDTYVTDVGLVVEDYPVILGLNASGTVAEVGPGVTMLTVGEKITAFQPFGQDAKTALKEPMQQFVILSASQCAKVPDNVALEAAATVPDNFITSVYTLFDQLSLTIPTSFPASSPPPNAASPILVYGAGSTTGQYALQLLHVAGPTLTADVAHAVGGDGKVAYAVDCITAENTLARIAEVLSPQGTIALLIPIKTGDKVAVGEAPMYWELPATGNPFAAGTTIKYVRTFNYAQPNKVRLLDQGTFKERVAIGLDLLRE